MFHCIALVKLWRYGEIFYRKNGFTTLNSTTDEVFDEFIKKGKVATYQDFTSMGGTDAAAALDQLNGVLATTIGLPARYIHSTAAMMDLRDLDAARSMVFEVVKSTNTELIEKIKRGYLWLS